MMRIRKSLFVLTIAAALALGMAGAAALQDGGGAGGKAGDSAEGDGALAFRMPAPIVDTELDKLVGRWAWEGQIFDIKTGEGRPMKARDEWKWGLNGQFLFLEFEAPDAFGPGKAMEGIWVVRPEGEGEYDAWWFDVLGTVEVSHGKLKDGVFTFIGESRWGESRAVFSIGDDGTYESSSDMKGPDGEWAPHQKGSARKVK